MTSTAELKRRVRTPLICLVNIDDFTAVTEAKKWLEANKKKAIEALLRGGSELIIVSQVLERRGRPGESHIRCEAVRT